MKDVFNQLLSMGFNAIEVSLQLISHKNGENYAYTNRQPNKTATVFGKSDVNVTLSIAKKGERFSDSSADTCYLWLWDCDAQEAQMYEEEFGKDAFIIVNEDGNGELVSMKMAQELLIPQDVPQQSASQQAQSDVSTCLWSSTMGSEGTIFKPYT